MIEYDGFEDHFTNARQVSPANWAFYYKPEDLERQMTSVVRIQVPQGEPLQPRQGSDSYTVRPAK